MEGFNVFKGSKQLAPAVNKEKENAEDGPSKAKKELNRQIEVLFLPSNSFAFHIVDAILMFVFTC